MPESTTARKSPLLPLLIAVVAALALAATLLLGGDQISGSPDPEAPSGSAPATGASSATAADKPEAAAAQDQMIEQLSQLARRLPDDATAMGEVDAPVVLVAYSEFQCPFCGKFARDTAPVLQEKFVDDGTLRIEWRDFPYLGPESGTAAQAGRAAALQGTFWEFHDAMFADQQPPNSGALDEDFLVGIAEEIGLDVKQFRADLTSEATRQLVGVDFSEGQSIGVSGTPTFLVNGRPIVGAQPTEVFVQAISEAAEAADDS